jgi:hypothetical protein
MQTVQTAQQVLDRHYLELRCDLLDLAAALDRIERSDGAATATGDARFALIENGIRILLQRGSARAEAIQMLFSDPYP